tara:strand:- start:168 stop:362 length:195 start_codon:yes stop_codon:yes gene_type:complete
MNGYTPSYKSSEDIIMPKKNNTKIKPQEIFDMPKVISATSSNQKKSKPKKNEKKITKKKNKSKK